MVSGYLLSYRQLVSNKNNKKETLDKSQELGNSLTQLKSLHKLTFLSLISVILREEYYIKIRWMEGVLYVQCVLTGHQVEHGYISVCRIELIKIAVATTKWITRWDLKFSTCFCGYLYAGKGNSSNVETRSNKNSCMISKLIQTLPYHWSLCK